MLPADDTATEVALDLLPVLGYAAAGFLIGILVSVVLTIIMRQLARRDENLSFLSRNLRLPQRVILTIFGTGMGVMIASAPTPWQAAPSWRASFQQVFLIVMIFAAAYGVTGIIKTVEDAVIARKRNARETPQFRRIRTQMQVITRVLIGVVWIAAAAGALLTFDQFRAIGASLLASAGLASLVAGLAAQSSLTNIFAGIQIAFTGSLKVGDIVVADENYGTIEEITLTYIVLKGWDERRWIVPSTLFTTKTFENWTREEPKRMGTIEFDLDWLVPVEAMRIELLRLVKTTDLWDGRTAGLQVTDATGRVSAGPGGRFGGELQQTLRPALPDPRTADQLAADSGGLRPATHPPGARDRDRSPTGGTRGLRRAGQGRLGGGAGRRKGIPAPATL